MKTYEETIDVVFSRIGEHNAARKRRNSAIMKAAASVCCLGLVAVVCFAALHGNFNPQNPDQTLDDALYPGLDDTIDPDELTVQNEPATPTPDIITLDIINLIVNPIEAVPTYDYSLFALMRDDFVELNSAQLLDYFGANIFPEMPEDLKLWEDQHMGLFRRNGGTGEVYWEQADLTFSNTDFSRMLHLSAQKEVIFSQFDLFLFTVSESLSNFGGTEVAFCQLSNGDYYAEFIYHDVCFRLSSEGLTQEEFVGVISSLIS